MSKEQTTGVSKFLVVRRNSCDYYPFDLLDDAKTFARQSATKNNHIYIVYEALSYFTPSPAKEVVVTKG